MTDGAIVFMTALFVQAAPPADASIDGRAPPASTPASPAVVAGRIALLPLRAASWLVLKPIEYGAGVAERHQLYPRAYEALTTDDRLVGLRPSVRYDTGLALVIGARYFDRRTLGPGSSLEATVRGGIGTAHASAELSPAGNTGIIVRGSYDHREDAVFGGTQGETRAELEAQGLTVARYAYSAWSASTAWQRELGQLLWAQVAAGIDRREYGNGRDRRDDEPIFDVYCTDPMQASCEPDPALVPGWGGIRLARGRLAVATDTRRSRRFGSGVDAFVAAGYAHGLGDDPSRHGSLVGRVGFQLAAGDHALVGRLAAGVVEPFGSAPVPFEELLTASGWNGIRGLPRGRLRGRTGAVGTLEYRWLLAPWLDAVLSVDRGNAYGPGFEGFGWGGMFTSYALGFVVVDLRRSDYFRSEPLFGAYLAVTPDDGLRLSLALSTW